MTERSSCFAFTGKARRVDLSKIEPEPRFFHRVTNLDIHAPIESHGFSEPSPVSYGLVDDIGEPRDDPRFLSDLQGLLGREFAVEETLHILGSSLQLSTIEEYVLRSMLDDAGQHVEERPLSLVERELSTGLYHDASRLIPNLLNDGAHEFTRLLQSAIRIELPSG